MNNQNKTSPFEITPETTATKKTYSYLHFLNVNRVKHKSSYRIWRKAIRDKPTLWSDKIMPAIVPIMIFAILTILVIPEILYSLLNTAQALGLLIPNRLPLPRQTPPEPETPTCMIFYTIVKHCCSPSSSTPKKIRAIPEINRLTRVSPSTYPSSTRTPSEQVIGRKYLIYNLYTGQEVKQSEVW